MRPAVDATRLIKFPAMPFTRTTHRFAAWLAMLAMLLGALAPTVAQAVVTAKGGPGWVQVCSASGMAWVQADALDSETSVADAASEAAVDASRHCPWCNPQGVAGLPPAPAKAIALAPRAGPPPARFQSAIPTALWPTAQSRAPPQA